MNILANQNPKRKVLSLKRQRDINTDTGASRQYLEQDISFFMVWSPDGDMPKRVYNADEAPLAIKHAILLAKKTGNRFYVMRTWRGFDAI